MVLCDGIPCILVDVCLWITSQKISHKVHCCENLKFHIVMLNLDTTLCGDPQFNLIFIVSTLNTVQNLMLCQANLFILLESCTSHYYEYKQFIKLCNQSTSLSSMCLFIGYLHPIQEKRNVKNQLLNMETFNIHSLPLAMAETIIQSL